MGWKIADIFNNCNSDFDFMDTVNDLKYRLFKYASFYAAILTQLQFIESKEVGVAATDGLRIYYNNKYMSKLTEGQRNYIIMHEIFHVMLLHCTRDTGRDPEIWNIAADCIVNCFIDKFAQQVRGSMILLQRPDGGCFMQGADEYSVEALYELMSDGSYSNEKYQLIISKFDNKKQSDLLVSDSVEKKEYIRQSILELMENATTWGNDGSEVTDRIFSLITARKRLPWKRLLKNLMIQDFVEDSSYITPERKYLHMGMIVSGWGMLESEAMPDIWAFVDASGSVSDEVINEFLAQLYIISKELGAVLNIAYWDTAVTDVYKKIKNASDVQNCTLKHSGGTDPTCIYEYLKNNKIMPEAMLILTDGYFYPVPDYIIGKYNKNTIVVISGPGMDSHINMGKEAKL